MAPFFASAAMVVLFMLATQGLPWRVREHARRWTAFAVVFFVFVSVFVDVADPLQSHRFATLMSGPVGTQAAAGLLAGAAIAWGLAREVPANALSVEGATQMGVALLVPLGVLFLTALLAGPNGAAALRSLEIGGLAKLEMGGGPQMAGALSAAREGPRPVVTLGTDGMANARPHLDVLRDYAQVDERDVFERDRGFIRYLAASGERDPALQAEAARGATEAAERAWGEQRRFLQRFQPFLRCLAGYVEASRDRPLIGITLTRAVLLLAVLEQAQGRGRGQGGAAWPFAQADGPGGLFEELGKTQEIMQNYLRAAWREGDPATQDPAVCSGGAGGASSAQTASLAAPTASAAGPPRLQPPHFAVFAAWSFSSVGSYELAAQTIGTWLDHFRTARAERAAQPGGETPAEQAYGVWFELRALMELTQIAYFHENRASESRLARRVIVETLAVMDRDERVPRLAQYGAAQRPRCHTREGSPPPAARLLLFIRAELTARMLHAVVDNEDGERELTEGDLRLARELRDLDLDCVAPFTVASDRAPEAARRLMDAVNRATYARVALAWAAKAEGSRAMFAAEAGELRRSARRELRAALHLFAQADREWRARHQCPAGSFACQMVQESRVTAEWLRARTLLFDVGNTED